MTTKTKFILTFVAGIITGIIMLFPDFVNAPPKLKLVF